MSNNKFSFIALLTLLVALTLATGCSPQQQEVKATIDHNGREMQLRKGQTLVVTLEANPTTGYSWEVAEPLDEQVLRQAGEPEFKAESEALGAGGVQILRFQAVNAGQTTLKLAYHRPWEKGVEPLETYSIEVVVR
ncbi:MAG: protease inhibitor I42 family protein [Chloroflexi bacterium]|nr:protease inhibitor I42 family protein [Chloroflexota bacterium]